MSSPNPPRPTEASKRFDARAANYDQQSLWVDDRAIIDAILNGLSPALSILEVAAGTGAVSSVAHSLGHQVLCADLSEGMLAQASAKGLPTLLADMHDLPMADKSIDVVLIRQGMQYARAREAVTEFARLARHTIRIAQIVAEDPAQQLLWQQLFALLGQDKRKVFVSGELAALIARNGLRLDYEVALYGRDRLISPNAAAKQLDEEAIEKTLLQIAPDASFDGTDWIHTVRWEVVGGAIIS